MRASMRAQHTLHTSANTPGVCAMLRVVTPVAVEQAIARTGQQYTIDLRTMLAELWAVYEGQVAAKDAALAAKDETIAELRRRAEVAEAEVARRQAEETAQAVQEGTALSVASERVDAVPIGRWARLWQRWIAR